MIDLSHMMEDDLELNADLPSLDEQKQIVAKLKLLEEKGQLTPEILEFYFGQKKDTSKSD